MLSFGGEIKGETGGEKTNKRIIKDYRVRLKSLTFLLALALLLSAFSGGIFIGGASGAIAYTEYTGTLGGADWALRIPDPWNGMLVVICRGTVPKTAPMPNPLLTLSSGSTMLEQGFAVAASNYGELGFCVQQGVSSTYEATMHIIENYGISGRVFLYGISLGGCIALLLGEKYPDVYSGVLDLSGEKDLKWRYNSGMRWANLSDAELTAELTALGIPVPPYGHSTLEEFRGRCANASRSTVLETGGTPETHPQEYEDRSPTYHANIMIPVITLIGTGDTSYYTSLLYQTAVAKAYRSDLYRLYSVPGGGHGEPIVMVEMPACFNELVEWSNELTGAHDWPMFHNNLQHTGYSTSNAPNTNQTLWTSTIGSSGAHPVVVDGKVYVNDYDGQVYCFDATTGAQIWNATAGNYARSSPAVADGKVYITSHDYNVYCFDALTGAEIWRYATGDIPASGAVVAGGKVYVGSHDGKLYCLRADWGQVEWTFTTGSEIDAPPAFAGGKVYFGTNETYKVYCVDAATGTSVWSYTTGGEVYGSPAVADGKVYVGSMDNNTYCLDAATGAKIWSSLTGRVVTSPAVAYGKLYVTSNDRKIYCLDTETGALIWSYTTGLNIWSSAAVADGKVYFGSFDRKFYCLDAATGGFIWSYTTGSLIFGSPVVANGIVYAVSYDNTVYAFSAWAPIPEGLTIGLMLLLSTIAVIVSMRYYRKRPKWSHW